MTNLLPEDKSHILVVEGPGDEYFFGKFLEHLGWRNDFHLINCDGKHNIARELSRIVNADDFGSLSAVGIILDNDYPNNRAGKSSIATAIEAIDKANESFTPSDPRHVRQLPKPKQPRQPAGIKPKLSVLLLPSDDSDGAVEDLVPSALPQDKVMDCVDSYFNCLCNAGVKANQSRLSKSKLSVYLSGKVADKDYARHDDSKRAFLTQAVEMKWWKDENMWDKCAFDDSKTVLQQLLAD